MTKEKFMTYSFNLNGSGYPVVKEFFTEKTACIKAGQAVYLDENGIVNSKAEGTLLGVAAEDHSGVKDILNERADGEKIRVDITKDAFYRMACPVFEAIEEGDTTSLICQSTMADADTYGFLILKEKGEGSINTDAIGTRRKIESVSASGSRLDFTVEAGGKICRGDKYAFCPMPGFVGSVDELGTCFSAAKGVSSMTVAAFDGNTFTLEARLDGKFFD